MAGTVPNSVNPEQKAAIEHGDGPLLIVAGAGTGKTTVITQRIAWLILERKVPTDGILALTFTDKAATEMEERVDRLLPYGYVNLWISTFHAFCERILREHALDIGLPGDFRLLNQSEQWLIIRKNLDRFDLDYYRPLGNPTRFIGALLKHFSRLEDEDISPEEYLDFARSLGLDRDEEHPKRRRKTALADASMTEAARVLEVAQAYATYRKLLLDESCLDFGMLITATLRLFSDRPAIRDRYRKQFRFLLVDEFQDTNWAQYELIKMLAAPRNNLNVVGDDDQSIYKFRGASVANILQFRNDFPEATQVVLTTNYRSRQNILDLAYRFIQQNNPNRLESSLSLPQGKRKKAVAANRTMGMSKKLIAADPGSGSIEFFHVRTQEEEVRQVVQSIVDVRKRERIEWKDIAILVRANDQAEPFIHGLEHAGVPYQFIASKGLYRASDVLNMTAFLRLLDDYHENPSLSRMLDVPEFRISAEDIVELASFARRKGISLYQSLIQSRANPNLNVEGRKGVDALLHLIRSGTAYSRTHKVTETLLWFLKEGGVLKELGKKASDRALERVAVMRRFLEEVAAFEKLHPGTSVREFLDLFQMKLDSGDAGSLSGTAESDADGVRVMTVHGAKGLEFAHVAIVQLVDRRFPTTERKDPIDVPEAIVRETLPSGDIHLEEERRLLYVAMTRAKRGLMLTAADDYGGVRAKKPSRFLYELGFLQGDPAREPDPLAVLERPERAGTPSPDVRFLGSKYSFSALRSYEKCPWQFRYAYLLRIPVAGNANLSYGDTLHATLQRFFTLVMERRKQVQSDLFTGTHRSPKQPASLPVSLEELLELFSESFIDDWYQDERQREDFRKRGRNALTEFYTTVSERTPDVLAVEQPFHWKLDQYIISGKIDRLDRLGEDPASKRTVVGIVDYKSGRTREMERADRYQLFLYALAVQDPNILNATVGSLRYQFLEDHAIIDVPFGANDLSAAQVWVRSVIGEIQRGHFDATPGRVCQFCDYRDICEFRE